jgi:3-hydroxyisobutyrate dehydrogenase-like beta-hydroxyacid dehydrogenase
VGAFADVTVTCVLNDDQTLAAVTGPEGVLSGARPGSCLVVHSTIGHSTIMALKAAAAAAQVELVDAPVSGGERGARAKTMSYMVGGSDEAVARCAPLFAASGEKITRTGEVGTATLAKIVHQHIVCLNMLAAHEGMRVGRAAGLSPEILMKIVSEGAAQSRMADNWFSLSLRPHAVGVFDKDLSLCLALADELGLPAPGALLAKQHIDEIVP